MFSNYRTQEALAIVACLAGLLARESSAQVSSPRYTASLVPPPPDFDYFEPRRINNRGEMVGRLDASSGPYHDDSHAGFYSGGASIDLHLLVANRGQDTSLPIALNDQGQVLFRALGSGLERSYLYQNGTVEDLNELTGQANMEPQGINNSGEIVGSVKLAFDSAQAFALADGKVRFLTKAHSRRPDSAAFAINDQGIIVGSVFDEANEAVDPRAAIFANNRTVVLKVPLSYAIDVNARGSILIVANGGRPQLQGVLWQPGGQQVNLPFSPSGMNDEDQVVGWLSPSWPPRAFLYSNGVTYNLNDLIDPASGWELFYAFDINNRGQIAGWGKFNGQWSGFVLTPAGP